VDPPDKDETLSTAAARSGKTKTAFILDAVDTKEGYERLVRLLDSLIDEVGNDESHPLASLMETIGTLVETYESNTLPEMPGCQMDALKALMEEHGLAQSDLREIGSQGVVSELLAGKRQLNLRQVRLLSERFKVSPVLLRRWPPTLRPVLKRHPEMPLSSPRPLATSPGPKGWRRLHEMLGCPARACTRRSLAIEALASTRS